MSQLVLAHEAVTQPKPPPPHPPLQALPKIEITGRIEPEDVKRAEKTSIQKMRERLDQAGSAPTFSFREKTRNDGTRISQIRTLSGVYCLEERRGQIDFSGINASRLGMPMRAVGKDCP